MTKSIHTRQYRVFCDLLIGERRKAGLSQTELADRLGRPQSYVSKYENAERRLDVVEFLDVMTALGSDPKKVIRKLEAGIRS